MRFWMSSLNEQIAAEFRANSGVVGGHFEGKHLLLLHTVGRRSGRELVHPLVYAEDGGSFVICGSNGGAQKEPSWVSNISEMSEVTIEVGERTLRAKPTVVTQQPEWDRLLYDVFGEYWPDIYKYEKNTDRKFPVVRLDPVG
jgi:deazaflavin-dependent oxidoreductase (nitroreductase family)